MRLAPLVCAAWLTTLCAFAAEAQAPRSGVPNVRDGQAQVIPELADPSRWIREQLWVETELDSDGDGRRDRVHVDVTRPGQTETEGLRVPVVYETSPYFAGVGSAEQRYFWNVRHALGAAGP